MWTDQTNPTFLTPDQFNKSTQTQQPIKKKKTLNIQDLHNILSHVVKYVVLSLKKKKGKKENSPNTDAVVVGDIMSLRPRAEH